MDAVYFDTNVYTQLNNLITSNYFEAYNLLKAAVQSDRLRIFTSATVLEETNGAPRVERVSRFRLIRKLAKRKKIIRPPAEILADDVNSYAKDQRFLSPFMAPFPRLRELWLGNESPGLMEAANETRASNRAFRNRMREAYSVHIGPLAQRVIDNQEVPTFAEHYQANATEFVRMVARQANQLVACEARGLPGLLEVPSINAVVGAQLSINYANTYLRRLQQQGDRHDVQHVQLAATVGTLVTEDAGLIRVVRRMDTDSSARLALMIYCKQCSRFLEGISKCFDRGFLLRRNRALHSITETSSCHHISDEPKFQD